MAVDNIKDFSIQWIQFGLLFFCLLTFALAFMFFNNPTGLGDSQAILEDSQTSVQSKLIATEDGSNVLLNITANTNPTEGYLGSRDSVATSYGTTGTAKGFFESLKIFMGWILTGTSGQILASVFGGIFGLLALYYIISLIRNGR